MARVSCLLPSGPCPRRESVISGLVEGPEACSDDSLHGWDGEARHLCGPSDISGRPAQAAEAGGGLLPRHRQKSILAPQGPCFLVRAPQILALESYMLWFCFSKAGQGRNHKQRKYFDSRSVNRKVPISKITGISLSTDKPLTKALGSPADAFNGNITRAMHL